MKSSIFALLSTLLFSFYIVAKETPPSGDAPKGFKLTETSSFTLDNGLQVTFVPYGKTPKTTVMLLSAVGNYDDGKQVGLADMAFQMLTEGTNSRTALDIAQQAASMGGEVTTSTSSGSSSLVLDVLTEFGTDAVELVADLALNSTFLEESLEREKANFIRNIQVQRAQAQGQASEKLYETVYGDHPYAAYYPDEAVFNTITTKNVKQFVENNLVAKRSHLFIAGVFDQAKLTAAIKTAFASLPQGEERQITAASYQGQGSFSFIHRENAPQSTLRLGIPVVDRTHEDYIGLQLMNTLLGGAFSSRITRNIREDKGYTYSPFSTLSTRVKSTLWYQGADVTQESTGASLKEIIHEVNTLQTQMPSKDEVDGFKSYMSGIFILRNSNRSAIVNQLWSLQLHGLQPSYLETYVQKLNDVPEQKLSDLAKHYLNVDNMTLVVVGDEENVMPQLKGEPSLAHFFAN